MMRRARCSKFGCPREARESLLCWLPTSQRLDAAAALLAFQAAHLGAECRPGWPARRRPPRGGADQLDKPRQRIVAVALLGAMTLGRDHQHAVAGQPPPRKPLQPCPHLVRQRRRTAHVEAQLHRRGKLVDILPAGAGSTDKAFRDLAIVDRDVIVDADHGTGSRVNLCTSYTKQISQYGHA